jgi:heme/copper-type cytochrome/quinol oxidase subunit 2
VEKLKADLAAMGITQLAAITKPHEIVCEELCGQGHGRMRGEMYMVSNQQYTHFLNLTAPATPTTAPRPPAPPVAQAAEQAAPAAQKSTQSVAQLPQPAARK